MAKFKAFLNNMWVSIVCRVLVGGLYVLSGVGKMMDLEDSVKSVHNFQIIPWTWMERIIGYVLPFVELILALCILFGILTRFSSACIGIFSIVYFIGKLDVMFIQGRSIDCGCFGALMNTMASVTVWMDMPVLILCLVMIYSKNRYNPGIGMFQSDRLKKSGLRIIW